MTEKIVDIQFHCPKCNSDFTGAFIMGDQSAELSQLRADLAAAQRERDEARARVGALEEAIDGLLDYRDHNTLNFQLEKADDWLNQLRAMTRTTSQSAMLTPRRCGTCAQDAAWKMREKCAEAVRKLSNINSAYEDAIRALPLPSCDGCNPLKPEATR